MPRRALILAAPVLMLAALAFGGCDDGGDNGGDVTPTDTTTAPTEEGSATFVSIPTETPPRTVTGPDIRREDLTQQPELRDFLSTAGGEVDPSAILYADLTDDGVEEAVVPVTSGGEGGNIALFAFGYVDGELRQLLRLETETSLAASIAGGELEVTEAVFQPGDPLACPSELKITTYRWDGSTLAVSDERTEPNTC